MRAVVLEAPGHFKIFETRPPSGPAPGQARVRVLRVGVCGTDLHAYQGRQTFFSYPRILGHELAVEVVAVGPEVTNVAVGNLCAVEPYLYCSSCIACRRGKTNCCENLKVLGVHIDGGMQEELVLPASNLHPSEHLPPEALALVEPLCIGFHAVRRACLEPDDTVLIVGAGPIGLSVFEAVRVRGKEPVVAEISPRRRQLCQEKLAVAHCVDASNLDAEGIRGLFNGDLPTVIFDCTGNPRSMERVFSWVAPGGKIVFVGHYPGDITFSDPLFHAREMTLYASRNATAAEFKEVIRYIEAGKIKPDRWITGVFTPEELVANFDQMIDPNSGALKVLLRWPGASP